VAEEVEHLASKYEALGSIPTTTQIHTHPPKKEKNKKPSVSFTMTKKFTL
jgi:hypothetical protein